jgi:GNAT superfamily N-acetyltransferase
MIELRVAETDEDLEAWRRVRIEVLPYERTASVAEMRQAHSPEKLLLLAFRDGELAGSGIAGQSDVGGGSVAPRVLPTHRRRGVGTAVLRACAEHLTGLGYDDVGTNVDDDGSLAFADVFGFRETGRQVEQVRAVSGHEPPPSVPAGVELVSLADKPELQLRTYHELALEAFADIPTPRPIVVTAEQWQREWITTPEGSFVALADGEIVGCAGVIRDTDRSDRAENSLTAVRRDWRGRGVARALKLATIAWASEQGMTEVYTWTQNGNENMQAVNEKLGYVTRMTSISVRRELPL